MKRSYLIVPALSLACIQPAAAQNIPSNPGMIAAPITNWSISPTSYQCILARNYGVSGKRALFTLTLEPLTNTSWLRLGIVDAPGSRDDGDAVMLADGGRVPGTLHYNIFSTKTHRVREFMLDLSRHKMGEVRQRIRFWTEGNGDVEIELGDFPAAWRTAQTCMDNLYAKLGVDRANLARVATPPKGSVYQFIATPPAPSDFAFIYWVDATGRVDDCKLLKPSGNASFDASLCDGLKQRARFEPARDADGNPIRTPRYDYARIRTMTTSS